MSSKLILSCGRTLFVAAATMGLAFAQTQDSSGDGLLKGTFNFRYLAVEIVDANNDPTDITSMYGTITFDGAGNYTGSATSIDYAVDNGTAQSLALSGQYFIGANGTGYLTNPIPLFSSDPNYAVNGAVAQGVFTGSSTESEQDINELNDIFIAIPAGTPPTNASFTNSYQTVVLDFPGATSDSEKNAQFQLAPDGKGGLGNIVITGQANNVVSGNNTGTLSQTSSGATYNFNTDGSATLTIPLPSGQTSSTAMFSGTKTMFESADGNFVLGWTPDGFDIFFGVKALATTATNSLSQGLYFTAALEDSPGLLGTDSYYGGTDNTGDDAGDGVVHQRLNIPAQLSVDYGSPHQIPLNPDGSAGPDFGYYEYFFGDGGQAFVAMGTSGLFSLQVGLHAPTFNPTGSVFLNPIGVANAASYQPITASLAPGEDIALFGSGLAAAPANVQGGNAFPTTLGGVSVTIDGILCPLYSVSPTQINAVVPYELASNTTGLADIQVTNNGVSSNVVQMYSTDSQPGAFSQNQNGIGLAAALHSDTGQLVTASNPANGGEYIEFYLTGLGTVNPPVQDGAVGPSNPLSWADLYNSSSLAVYFNDYTAQSLENEGTIQYAGLVPTLAGLYQINVQVPVYALGAGDNVYVEFVTDAADVNQIQIPFGTDSNAFARPQPLTRAQAIQAMRAHPRTNSKRRPRHPALMP